MIELMLFVAVTAIFLNTPRTAKDCVYAVCILCGISALQLAGSLAHWKYQDRVAERLGCDLDRKITRSVSYAEFKTNYEKRLETVEQAIRQFEDRSRPALPMRLGPAAGLVDADSGEARTLRS